MILMRSWLLPFACECYGCIAGRVRNDDCQSVIIFALYDWEIKDFQPPELLPKQVTSTPGIKRLFLIPFLHLPENGYAKHPEQYSFPG
jgi:hypothetical protein